MKRGHSNVYPAETKRWRDVDPQCEDGVARIPIRGGASFQTVKELPPLAMREGEWREIGSRMGWVLESESAKELLAALVAATKRMEAVASGILIEKRHKGVSPRSHVTHMAGHLEQHAKRARAAIAKAMKGA